MYFSLVWVTEFSIISLCLDKDKKFSVMNANGICIYDRFCTLFKKSFFLFHTILLRCFIYSRCKVSYILHGPIISVASAKEKILFLSSYILYYYLPARNVKLQEKPCLLNWFAIFHIIPEKTVSSVALATEWTSIGF